MRRVSSIGVPNCGVENVSDTFDCVDVDWADRFEFALGDLVSTAFLGAVSYTHLTLPTKA